MGVLRIVAGEKKGHRLRVPTGSGIRPTGERVREALFSVVWSLWGELSGAVVLDLFAGTGALGLEALSRGADRATFVDADRRVVDVLRQNVSALGYGERAEILAVPYRRALALLADRGFCYDLLFIDPPYRMLPEVAKALAPALPGLVNRQGLVLVEGPRDVDPDVGLPLVLSRRYGDTSLTVFGREETT